MNRLDKLKSFRGITSAGLLSNSLFVLFIIVTLIYYSYFMRTGNIVPVVEVIAYSIEVLGFLLMAATVVGYFVKLRDRMPLKIAMALYFLTEFIIMICDFNLIDVSEFYSPASRILILSHCIFSAVVVMFYLQLDNTSKSLQISVSVAAVLCVLASFSIVFNVRVYASVLVNSIAYIVLYTLILHFEKREQIFVDCYDDVPRVYEESSFFEDENK